ncbi:MAG TPA: hypothetical protein ENH82_18095 [bacterium]|nr:hypothetical protein [bacterium]
MRDYNAEAQDVLDFLNYLTKRRYRNTIYIVARLKDGASVDDCRKVIWAKGYDDYFRENPKYLNPITLFRKLHWDNYYNESLEEEYAKEYTKCLPDILKRIEENK